jgi:hypothetical protein
MVQFHPVASSPNEVRPLPLSNTIPWMICCYILVPFIDIIGAGLVGSEVLGLFVFKVKGKG